MNVPKVIVATQAELNAMIAATTILPHQLYYIAEVTVGEVTTPAKLMYGKSSSVVHTVVTDSLSGGIELPIAISDVTNLQTGLDGKLVNSMATSKLLGRGTAGTGAIEEITLGTNLSLSGTTLNATGGGAGTTFYTPTDLSVDGANGNYFLIEISANASFSLSNIAVGTQYYFRIKNTSAGAITITLPNTADIKKAATFTVGASNKYVEAAMIYDGTNRTWQISEELS